MASSLSYQKDNAQEGRIKSYRNSPVIGEGGVNTRKGDNSRYARQVLDVMHTDELYAPILDAEGINATSEELEKLRFTIVDINDVETLCKRFIGYVAYCINNDTRITNLVAYKFCGINKEHIYNWSNGKSRNGKHQQFALSIKEYCGICREQMGVDGKLSPVTLIWQQKQYEGYSDNQQLTIVSANGLGEEPDRDAIAQEYLKALPDTIIE